MESIQIKSGFGNARLKPPSKRLLTDIAVKSSKRMRNSKNDFTVKLGSWKSNSTGSKKKLDCCEQEKRSLIESENRARAPPPSMSIVGIESFEPLLSAGFGESGRFAVEAASGWAIKWTPFYGVNKMTVYLRELGSRGQWKASAATSARDGFDGDLPKTATAV